MGFLSDLFCGDLKNQLQQVKDENEKLKQELEVKNNNQEILQAGLQERIDNLQQKNQELISKTAELNTKLESLNTASTEQNSMIDYLLNANNELEEKNKKLTDKISEAGSADEEQRKKNSQLKDEIRKLEQQLASKEHELSQTSTIKYNKDFELEQAKVEIEQLKKRVQEAEEESTKFKLQLCEEKDAPDCSTCDVALKLEEYLKRNNDLSDSLQRARLERNQLQKQLDEVQAQVVKEVDNEELIDEDDRKPSKYKLGKFYLNKEQARVIDSIEAGGNFFITGEAGTGKSVVLKYLRDHTKKQCVVVAPTGIAAVNVGGQTIHSFFKLTLGAQDIRTVKGLGAALKEKLSAVDLIIIDEISMVRSDMMDMIDHKMKLAKGNNKPFGGCQVVVFGDLYQLPPVVATGAEKNFIDATYCSEYFFDAPAIKYNPFTIISLKVNNRQGADKEFAKVLNRIRVGDNGEDILEKINARRYVKITDDWDGIRLMPHSQPVKDYNDLQLAKLRGAERTYTATVTGDFEKKEYPLDYNMKLKVGARVMFARNDLDGGMYSNGSMGTIVDLEIGYVKVKLKDGEHAGEIVNVYPSDYDNFVYGYEPASRTIKMASIGKFKQIPLKLAYAITIHKSQGQTYTGNVCLDYGRHHAFADGQTYVGLSRVTSLNNLYLTDAIKQEDITIDQRIVDYLEGKSIAAFKIHNNDYEVANNCIVIDPPKNPKKITGTRVGSIHSVNPFISPFEAWCDMCSVASDDRNNAFKKSSKSRSSEDEANKYQNKFTEAGVKIEPKVIDYCRNKYNNRVLKVVSPIDVFGDNAAADNNFNFFPDAGYFGGMWDAKINGAINGDNSNIAVIEIKTTSMSNKRKWYGENGTENNIPKYYMLQAALYAYLLGVDKFIFATAHLEGREWYTPDNFKCNDNNIVIKEYSLSELYPNFKNEIYDYCKEWYENHILTGISPEYDRERDAVLWSELTKNKQKNMILTKPKIKKKSFGEILEDEEILEDW